MNGADYGAAGVTGAVAVTVTENDRPELRVSLTQLMVEEEGATAPYSVRLNMQPSGVQTVTVGVTPTGKIEADTDPNMNGAQTELTFTDATWDAAQTVTVRADGDADAQADEATLTHRVGGYAGAAPEETVNVADDEVGVELSQQAVTVQGGARNTYMVRLVAQPAGPVKSGFRR